MSKEMAYCSSPSLNLHNERLEEKFITVFDDTIKAVFGEDIIKTGDSRAFDHMGHFELTYNYLPHNYTINLEHEMGFIDIRINDSQNAWAYFTKGNKLYRKNAEGIKRIKTW